MDSFNLSPGITPALTDAALLAYVLVPFAGYLLADRRGLLVGFVAVSIAVAAIKLVTDWSDAWDDLVSAAAIVAPILWAALELRGAPRELGWRVLLVLVGLGAVAVGLVKIRGDFYDPFDLLVALSGLVGGLGILRRTLARPGPPAAPRSATAAG